MRKYYDLTYSKASPNQKLDLYLPKAIKGPYPLIVFIHGGGWQIGDKRDGQYRSWINLVNSGYALASINYRMFPESVYPDGLLDCKKALQFLYDNRERYELDMDNIGVVGNSAGGYYALMLAVTVDNPKYFTGYPDIPIKCCVVWYAPTDFYNGKDEVTANLMNRIKYGLAIGCIEKYFGKNFNQITDQELIDASPVTYIDLNLPPILIQQGDKDFLNPPSQAELFLKAAQEKGVGEQVEVEFFEGAGHVDPVFDERSNKIRIRRFLNKYLKSKKAD